MQFIQHYSGSSANLYEVVSNNGDRLLIECGVSWRELQEALKFNLHNIVGCFISHEHADHSKAIREVIKAGIDVYVSHGTFEALGLDSERRVGVVANKTLVKLDSFQVYCFDVNHDAAEPLGFVVREKATNEYLLFATDTSHITQRFKYQFSIVAIECSYCKEILQERVETGDINKSLAVRLLTSHMEKQNTMAYLTEHTDLSNCHQINLLHLSGDNIEKEQTRVEFEKRFFIETKLVS